MTVHDPNPRLDPSSLPASRVVRPASRAIRLASLVGFALATLALIPLVGSAQVRSGAAVAPAPDAHRAAIEAGERWLAALAAESDLPGVQVAVAKEGRIGWSRGLGFADLESGVPVTPETRFRIGSVSKPLTAAAALTLHRRGRLDLDADVRRYVPSFPARSHPVTSRQLLGHLGGIRHYRDDESTIRHRGYDDVVDALEIFAADSLVHEPGTAYEYSSYGYNLLSAVIQRASGRPFLSYVRSAVLEPLEMDRTVADHADSVIAGRAAFYRESDTDGRLLNAPFTDNSYKWASGGYLSTAEDLVRFASGLIDGDLLGAPLVDTMFTPMVLASGDTSSYAMGWRPREDWEGRPVVRHGGSSVGGRAFLLAYPERGLAVSILVNASLAPVFAEEAQVLAHLFLDHPPDAERIGTDGAEIAGRYRFETVRGDDEVEGTLHLTGSRGRPGWMEWEDASGPVPIVLVDRHDEETRLFGAGAHGALTVWATFDDDGFHGRWNWLGRTSELRGRRVEEAP